jgi:hypothetical protein
MAMGALHAGSGSPQCQQAFAVVFMAMARAMALAVAGPAWWSEP